MTGKIDAQVAIDQPGHRERVFAHHVVQVGAAVGKQQFTVRQDEIEGAVRGDLASQQRQRSEQHGARRLLLEPQRQARQQVAERALAVGVAQRRIQARVRFEIDQVAVMGERPGPAPQLARKRMAVFQRNATLGGLADMRHHAFRLDRLLAKLQRQRRIDRGQVVGDQPAAVGRVDGDTPAIPVFAGAAAALGKAGEGKIDGCRFAAVHGKELTHGGPKINNDDPR